VFCRVAMGGDNPDPGHLELLLIPDTQFPFQQRECGNYVPLASRGSARRTREQAD
jgi:hypothetical protein